VVRPQVYVDVLFVHASVSGDRLVVAISGSSPFPFSLIDILIVSVAE